MPELDLRLVGLAVRGADPAQSAGSVVVVPLVFASSVFVPVAGMPHWLQTFAKASPVTLTANTELLRAPASGAELTRAQQRPGSRGYWPCSSRCASGDTGG